MKGARSWRRNPWVALACALELLSAVTLTGETSRVTRRGTGETVAWESLRGNWVVLDFFAHWCGPCLEASRQIQTLNAPLEAGPVTVLPINVDVTGGARTDRFIQAAGLETVYEDPGGQFMNALGGRGLPFIVILDARGAAWSGTPPVAAIFEGFPGVEVIRQRLVQLGNAGSGRHAESSQDDRDTGGGLWPRLTAPPLFELVEMGTEVLWDSDFRLYQTSWTWRESRPGWDYLIQAGWNRHDLDYQPAPTDFISQATELTEDMISVLARLRARWGPRLKWELGGGWYDGFSDYRSVWLDEYYRQFFGPVPGYREADPSGFHLGPGIQWDAIPGSTIVQAGLVYQFDQVAPGYEKEPFRPLIRGAERLDTLTGTLGVEQVLSKRVRVLQEVRLTDTTERDLRVGYKASMNGALGRNWVVRGVGGVTHEGPSFLAWQVQANLDFDVNQRWFVGVFGRYYEDNGLVRDPRLVSSASPPLATLRTGVAIRYQSESFSFKLSSGPYWTWYDEVAPISQDFSTLYSSRDWLFVEAAVGYRF